MSKADAVGQRYANGQDQISLSLLIVFYCIFAQIFLTQILVTGYVNAQV